MAQENRTLVLWSKWKPIMAVPAHVTPMLAKASARNAFDPAVVELTCRADRCMGLF